MSSQLYTALKDYPEDEYIFKGCDNYIVVMKLLEDSVTNESRKSIIDVKYAKHRTNKVKVILIIHKFTLDTVDNVKNSIYEKKLKYVVNERIEEKDYDMNLNNVYSAGIHYFKKIECAFYFTVKPESCTGHYIEWFTNGQKKQECDCIDGEYYGQCTNWYENGQKNIECNYIDDKYNGHYISWYENGQKSIECNYVNNKRNGHGTEWREDGQKNRM